MAARPLTLSAIAALVGGTLHGNGDRVVARLATPDDAGPDALAPVWDARLIATVHPEALLLVAPGALPPGRDGIEVKDPRGALPRLLPAFTPVREVAAGIHPTAVIDATATVDPAATVGPLCVVGPGARVGARTVLEGQVFLGRNVVVGDDCWLEPQVVLYDDTSLGARVMIHAGTAIGCDGFGFLPGPGGTQVKIPQVGRVVIEDDVEIGALCTIDRATIGETRIGRGTKTDDHVHVGHNSQVGANCLLVAFTGLSGSTTLEDNVTMASRSGTVPHVTVGKGAVVAGVAGVTMDVPPGAFVSGFPAQDHRTELRQQAFTRRLPELFARVRQLEARLTGAADRPAGGD